MASGEGATDRTPIDELETLLCAVARGLLPNRAEAIAYAQCRSHLLQSSAKELLPGFVYQCISVTKFKDFITLYDPDVDLREAFVRRALDRCRQMMDRTAARETRPVGGTGDLDPQQWMR